MSWELAQIEKAASIIVRSGLFGIRRPEEAVTLMLLAQAEGLHPVQAFREFYIVNGRPALRADAMLARFQQAGGRVEWHLISDEAVEATFSHPSGGSARIRWTLEDAQRAGLTGDNWRKYPRAMLRARCISEGIRTVYPSVVTGVYTPEEVADFTNPSAPVPVGAQVATVEVQPAQHPAQPLPERVEATPAPAPELAPEPEPVEVREAQAQVPAQPSGPTQASGPAQDEAHDRITEFQLRKIWALAREKLGLVGASRDEASREVHLYASAVLGREVGSMRELTRREASAVIEALLKEGGDVL